MGKIILAEISARRDCAVVGVVKKEFVAAGFGPVFANPSNEFWIIPLVDDHDIGIAQRAIEIQSLEVVADRMQKRETVFEFANGPTAVLRNEVGQTPAVTRLVDGNIVTAFEQFRRNAPEEMSVTMVPIGN